LTDRRNIVCFRNNKVEIETSDVYDDINCPYLCDLLLLHKYDLDFGMAYDKLYCPSTCTHRVASEQMISICN